MMEDVILTNNFVNLDFAFMLGIVAIFFTLDIPIQDRYTDTYISMKMNPTSFQKWGSSFFVKPVSNCLATQRAR